MRLFGFDITRAKAVPSQQSLSSVGDRGNWWWPVVREPFTGAWQRNREIRNECLLANYAVFSCLTIIPSDVAKCRLMLVEKDNKGIWSEVEAAAFSPLFRKPNRYQTRIQFYENWVVSKLVFGNTYVLLERDNRNVVAAMYVLDPTRVKVLVAPDGSVFYELGRDNLAGQDLDNIVVPASEIIHDRWPVTLHPLVGLPPLGACRLAANASESIQAQSAAFFANGARPSGILTSPNQIEEEDAVRFKEHWLREFGGANYGTIAIMDNGLDYKQVMASAIDTQLVEQLGTAGKIVATAFGVPAYMVGLVEAPNTSNIEALHLQYYSQCLQKLFEAIEELLDDALGLPYVAGHHYGAEFDLENLLRMDTSTRIKTYAEGVKGGLLMPDEGRSLLGYGPVEGGNQVYLQQQNYSLAALAKRDAKADPFATSSGGDDEPADDDAEEEVNDDTRSFADQIIAKANELREVA